MPLIKGKSKKAFSENVKTEMDSGKPQDQALAIAYSVKRKKKKMADGGEVDSAMEVVPDKGFGKIIRVGLAEGGEISASNEKRPMPQERDNDADMVAKNAAKKALVDSDWTDNPTVKQAQKPSLVPLSRPKMVGSDAFSVRDRDDVDRDLRRMDSEVPSSPEEQPSKRYDEEGPDRQGPPVSDMQDEHSTHRRPYAKGGQVEQSDYSSPENKYEHDFKSDTPSEDEGSSYARSRNEEGPDRQGPPKSDNEAPHSMSSRQYKDSMSNEDHAMDMNPAQGKYSASSGMYQPSEEEAEERHNSIAAAIMSKKEREKSLMSDSDMDEMVRLYEGGEITRKSGKINGMDSIYTHEDEDQADLSRNAEEDANLEDQGSFDALRKENYSESEGLRQMDSPMDSAQKSDEEEMGSHDKHDMVSSIRSKMKAKRQFKSK